MTTSPDSVNYPPQGYGILSPMPAHVVNIQNVPGADPTGINDSTVALQEWLDSIPDDGGVAELAPGIYKFRSTLEVKSNTVIRGSGTLKAAPVAEWIGERRAGLLNVNYLQNQITDENITIQGITIDYTDVGLAGGTAHCIYMRYVRKVRVLDCTIIDGASSCALLGSEDTLEDGNRYINFRNCGSDHWTSPINNRVIGCYMESAATAQMVNFNPENSDLIGTGLVANGFVMTGCTLVSTAASADPCQIEPLAAGNTVKSVTISGNVFKNTYLVLRGDVQGAVVTGNTFSNFAGDSAAIYAKGQFGARAKALTITGNTILDPLTASPSEAVIVAESDSAIITGNIIMGTAYTALPISGEGDDVQVIANYAEAGPVAGRLQGAIRLLNGTDNYYGWTDTGGANPRMYLQTDDNWIWYGTGAAGVDRFIATLQMRSSSSELNWAVPHRFASYTRSTPATVAAAGTVIAGATALTADINNVATCTAGVADGVVLQPVDGQRQTVINTSADTLKVYPNNNGVAQIDNGGVGIPVTIAAGKAKTFVRVASNNFRTIAAT